MNNQYIFYPSFDLDLEKIKKIVFKNLYKLVPGAPTHHRLVKNEPYLVDLKTRYPFLSNIYNIYPTNPGYVTPIHICPGRSCALNIPIEYTEDSHTVFYELCEPKESIHNTDRVYDVINSDVKEVFRYTLTRPVIMNTLLPHGVFGGPDKMRIIMSWSITFDVSYEELRSKFSE
jgi:hypothetical protein